MRLWEVQDAVFLRRLEVDTGVVLGGRLPPVEWEGSTCGGGSGGDGGEDAKMPDLPVSAPDARGGALLDGVVSGSRARVDSRLG